MKTMSKDGKKGWGKLRIVYLDCVNGASGDMLLGALLGCGLDRDLFTGELAKLSLPGWRLRIEPVKRYGLAAAILHVDVEEQKVFRHLPDILDMINRSTLPSLVKEKSMRIFENLARAEAEVHGVKVDEVHFHEVGAVDSIVDIVGTVTALHLLGIAKVYASPLPLGHGKVKAAHGWIPVPVPATLALLRMRGSVPVYGAGVEGELVTPTGAAILTSLVEEFGALPEMELKITGCSSGKRDYGYPNILRAIIGVQSEKKCCYGENQILMETNIDDLNPEVYDYVIGRLFDAGALDVYITPVQMKKNRPAVKLSILATPERVNMLTEVLFMETSTIGLRCQVVEKIMLHRHLEKVSTPWGEVRVKVAAGQEGVLNVSPEYEDCRRIAVRERVSLKEVYKEVDYCWRAGKKSS